LLAVLLLAGCAPGPGADSNAGVYEAWRAQRSQVEVTASGSVARLLGLRRGPSGLHEGFLMHLRGDAGHGLTVRVEDNVDITGEIPLAEGDAVEVRGEYVYDSRGGVIHYTHHDPRGRHPAGYVRVGEKTFH
jgi:Protein of unknown function (DUF3465)